MAEQTQKTAFQAVVRISGKAKERLVKVRRRMADTESREVTEGELVSEAVNLYCEQEEKKLGLS